MRLPVLDFSKLQLHMRAYKCTRKHMRLYPFFVTLPSGSFPGKILPAQLLSLFPLLRLGKAMSPAMRGRLFCALRPSLPLSSAPLSLAGRGFFCARNAEKAAKHSHALRGIFVPSFARAGRNVVVTWWSRPDEPAALEQPQQV